MKKIEEFSVMESFGMDEITVDDMFDVDATCFIDNSCNCKTNTGNNGDSSSNSGHGSGSGNGNGNGNGNKGC